MRLQRWLWKLAPSQPAGLLQRSVPQQPRRPLRSGRPCKDAPSALYPRSSLHRLLRQLLQRLLAAARHVRRLQVSQLKLLMRSHTRSCQAGALCGVPGTQYLT